MSHRMNRAALAAAPLVAASASPNPAEERFAKLKALVGNWTMAGGDGSVAVNYRLTGGGSALIETLFPGQDHEMMTVYTIDKGDVVLTHYCTMGNQPRMKAAAGG